MEKTSNHPLLRRFSAVAPIVMSACAFAVVVIALNFGDPGMQPDEGAAAHLFQLLMAGQAPIVAFFAIKWLPRDPAPSMFVLAAQAFAAALALAPVLWFGL